MSPSDSIEGVVYVDECTTRVEVALATGGKCNSRVDNMEKICVASHTKKGATLEEETSGLTYGNVTSTKEIAGTGSAAGIGDGNPI